MFSFTLVEPKPVTEQSTLAAPSFSTNILTVPSKPRVGAFRRSIKKRVSQRYSLQDVEDDDEYGDVKESDESEDEEDDNNEDEDHASKVKKRSRSQDSAAFVSAKKARITGGRTTVHKDIGFEFDSDDEIIWTMKSTGQKDEAIVERLISEGRVKYAPKTISTRYARLCRAREDHEEKLMELNFSDYHEVEDDALNKAYDQTESFFQRALADINTKRYREIAKLVNNSLPNPKYSRKACIERLDSIHIGTAVVPFEQDDNQEARRAKVLKDVAARKVKSVLHEQTTSVEANKKKHAREEEQKLKAETRAKLEKERFEKVERIAASQQARADELAARVIAHEKEAQDKLDLVHQKQRRNEQAFADKEAAKLLLQQEKDRARQEAKVEQVQLAIQKQQEKIQQIRMQETALFIVKAGMKEQIDLAFPPKPKAPKRVSTGKATASASKQKSTTNTPTGAAKQNATATPTNASTKTSKQKSTSTPGSATKKRPAPVPRTSAITTLLPTFTKTQAQPFTPVKTEPAPTSSVRTTASVSTSSPRISMTVAALKNACRERGLRISGTKPELMAVLAVDDKAKSGAELREMLEERGLAMSGSKEAMIERIARDDASQVVV